MATLICTHCQSRHQWIVSRNARGRLPRNWRRCPCCGAWLGREEGRRQLKGIYPPIARQLVTNAEDLSNPGGMYCCED